MANKKIGIDLVLETADAANSIKDIKKSIGELENELEGLDIGSKEFKKINDKAKQLKTTLEGVGGGALKKEGSGIKGIGVAFKAAGIGLIIAGFAALKEILEQQQPVLDAIDTAMTGIGLVIISTIKNTVQRY